MDSVEGLCFLHK